MPICGRATLTRPEANPFSPLATDHGAPVFDEQWQAQTLALAYALAESGVFSSAEWSDMLGAKLDEAKALGRPDDQHTYYDAALAALEALLAERGTVGRSDLQDCVETWRRAYLNTPHGAPVEYEAGREG